MHDAAHLYALAATHLPGTLVPERSRARTARFASLLPPAISVAAFECRLAGGADSAVDYSVCYRSGDSTRRILAGQATADASDAAWRAARAGLRRWAEQIPQTGSPAIWVEIDSGDDETLRPFLVHTLPEISDDDLALRSRRTRAAVRTALDLSDDDALLDGLDSVVDRLPPWCAVRHVALRPLGSVRILRVICRLPSTRAAAFAAGGASSPAGRAIDEMTAIVYPHPAPINLNLDVSPALGPRLGVEFDFPARHPRWVRVFDTLESAGLLARERREALVAWQSGPCPEAADPSRALVRDVLIKVDFDQSAPYQAKAYLPFASLATLRALQAPESTGAFAA